MEKLLDTVAARVTVTTTDVRCAVPALSQSDVQQICTAHGVQHIVRKVTVFTPEDLMFYIGDVAAATSGGREYTMCLLPRAVGWLRVRLRPDQPLHLLARKVFVSGEAPTVEASVVVETRGF